MFDSADPHKLVRTNNLLQALGRCVSLLGRPQRAQGGIALALSAVHPTQCRGPAAKHLCQTPMQ
eukprot:scaffold3697_cov390-Prasinococcus_capsulatus_cf.AAC.7